MILHKSDHLNKILYGNNIKCCDQKRIVTSSTNKRQVVKVVSKANKKIKTEFFRFVNNCLIYLGFPKPVLVYTDLIEYDRDMDTIYINQKRGL